MPPPSRMLSRRVARRSTVLPFFETFFLRVRISGSGRRSRESIFFASTSSAADMVSKSMRASTSREEKVSLRFELELLLFRFRLAFFY